MKDKPPAFVKKGNAGNKYGRMEDFRNLISEGTARTQGNAVPEKLPSLLEDDVHDINICVFGLEEMDRDKGIKGEAMLLQKPNGELGALFGETLDVPVWARVAETGLSYYA